MVKLAAHLPKLTEKTYKSKVIVSIKPYLHEQWRAVEIIKHCEKRSLVFRKEIYIFCWKTSGIKPLIMHLKAQVCFSVFILLQTRCPVQPKFPVICVLCILIIIWIHKVRTPFYNKLPKVSSRRFYPILLKLRIILGLWTSSIHVIWRIEPIITRVLLRFGMKLEAGNH